jgi:hypothetical protein
MHGFFRIEVETTVPYVPRYSTEVLQDASLIGAWVPHDQSSTGESLAQSGIDASVSVSRLATDNSRMWIEF